MAREKKERKLTEAEQKRLEEFNANCEVLESLGYRRTDLSISIFWANVIAIVAVIALFAICMPLFNMLHPNASFVIPASVTEIADSAFRNLRMPAV